MLRAHAFVTVRQQQDQVAGRLPLRFGGDDELVDHRLRAVGEIAELRLPQRQHGRIAERVTIIKPQHGELGQQRVEHAKPTLLRTHLLQRNVPRAGFVIVKHRVALGKRAASAVLAG